MIPVGEAGASVAVAEPKAVQFTPKEQFELLGVLLQRNDGLRSGNVSRASVIITANAIVIAAVSFAVQPAHGSLGPGALPVPVRVVTVGFLGAAVALSCISLWCAITGMLNVWTHSRDIIGAATPPRVFFHVHETVRKFPAFSNLKRAFDSLTYDDLITAGLAEFLAANLVHSKRYNDMRRAGQCLVLSVLCLSLAILGTLAIAYLQ